MTKKAPQPAPAERKRPARKPPGNPPVGKALVIVESPAKAKTINKYLGSGYVVKACKGHVRDLPLRRYGIDPGRNFEPTYEILHSHRKVVEELRKAAEQADTVYLATDLDREGEAIAWHLVQALELPPERIRRVVFNEITKSAVQEAFAHPHEIDTAKVDAQQARRILDRVVGYELSPLLWKKIAKGLSAGRVQSVAVRMIVDREQAIRDFVPTESWVVTAIFAADPTRAEELSTEWHAFLKAAGPGSEPAVKDRFAWLAQRHCVEAALVEVDGRPFRMEAAATADTGGSTNRGFRSAADSVRPIIEALGYQVHSLDVKPWEAYARLGLEQVRFQGRTVLAHAPAYGVKSLETKRTLSRPPAPFTTATLQQAAANLLRFPTSKTMKLAQALYEGVDIKTGEGNVGLITYMRTDSTNLSAESVRNVRDLIAAQYGERYLPPQPNRYGNPRKAQEAHEAIRPTDPARTPESLRGHLTPDQHKLYTLIWNRFVACQMVPAQWDATTVLISAQTRVGEAVFKATGRVLVFDGFYRVAGLPREGDEQVLPPLQVGKPVAPIGIEPEQKYTSPPPRYTEASLVKALEAEGIGRPSTYAAIIQTIQDRGYVEQEDRKFRPTPRGEMVTQKLVAHFPKIMDVGFTSFMEDELDKIEEQHIDWHEVLHEFYDPFKTALAKAHQEMDVVRAEASEYTCDACGRPMVYRFGKNGRFLACSGYPECKNAREVDPDGKMIQPVAVSETCELCGRPMVLRRSKRGPFLGCSGYPECSFTKPCNEDGRALRKVRAEDIREPCPECGRPTQVKFARGRAFLGCTAYPECKGTAPLPDGVYVERPKPQEAGVRCDRCGRPMVVRKSRRGPFLSCSGFPRCRNALPMDKLEHLRSLEATGEIPPPPTADGNGNAKSGNGGSATGGGKTRGKAVRLKDEEVAALGPPPPGFAWTRTGRPVVDEWPEGDLACFSCGEPMTLRHGRFGPFYGCPKCKAVANLRGEAKKKAEAAAPAVERAKPIETDVSCPECGAKMVMRMGKTGRFLGCSAYPKCRKTMEVPPGLLRELAGAGA